MKFARLSRWGELENGDLLNKAEAAGFDLLIICDKNLRHQQNLTSRQVAILELWTNHRPTLEKYFHYLRQAAESMRPGQLSCSRTAAAVVLISAALFVVGNFDRAAADEFANDRIARNQIIVFGFGSF